MFGRRRRSITYQAAGEADEAHVDNHWGRCVTRSFDWYQSLFGLPESVPAHDYFGQVLDTDGTVLLCLHKWGAHEHPTLVSPDRAEPGNGSLLFLRVDDFDEALSRARALVSQLAEEPQTNPATGTREFALRDPDGYYVMVSALA
jgi:catechol 2,3-dioxygenase-like lactoylglutathione lyase family enzyme